MKYQQHFKVPTGLIRDSKDSNIAVGIILNHIVKQRKKHLKKSYVMKDVKVAFYEQDADNVLNNLTTVQYQYNLYKAPRIVSKLYPEKDKII